MKSALVIASIDDVIAKWSRGSYKGPHVENILLALPVPILPLLTFIPCKKQFTNMKLMEVLMKLVKKSRSGLNLDLEIFAKSAEGSNDAETMVLKLAACVGRSAGFEHLRPISLWIRQVAERDPKIPKTSLKNIQLAKQIVRDIDRQ